MVATEIAIDRKAVVTDTTTGSVQLDYVNDQLHYWLRGREEDGTSLRTSTWAM